MSQICESMRPPAGADFQYSVLLLLLLLLRLLLCVNDSLAALNTRLQASTRHTGERFGMLIHANSRFDIGR